MGAFRFFILLFVFYSKLTLHAQDLQRFNCFNYSVNEGLLQSNVLEIAFDSNNFCWLSFANGIQKFDGKTFTIVPVQAGLPDDKWVKFFRCRNGDLLISHSQGISKYEIKSNRFTQVYSNPATIKTPPVFIGEDEQVVYIYTAGSNITGMGSLNYKVMSDTKTGFPALPGNASYRPKMTSNIINHKVAIQVNAILYLWDLQKKKQLFHSGSIDNIGLFFLRLKNETTVLYCTYKNNLIYTSYHFSSDTYHKITALSKNGEKAFRTDLFSWQNKTLLSCQNLLYETDTNLKARSLLVNFQNQPVSGSAVIVKMSEDNFGNLYLVTINDGIRKIIRNNYPVKYYGTEKKEDNYTLCVLPDKANNRILAGTYGSGLLVFDTLQHLVKHINTLPGESHSFFCNSIIKNNRGDYLLFVGGENVWQLSKDLLQLSRIKITTALPENKTGIGYFANVIFRNESGAIVQSQSNIYRVSFEGNKVSEYQITNTSTMSGLLYSNYIITHANDELIYLDATTFKELKKIPFKNTGQVRCFAKDAAGNIYIGCNKGIFKINGDGKIILYLNKEKGLPDECIYAMAIDETGALWCSSNRGIFKVNKDNSILQLKKEVGLQENEFNTNTVAIAEDGETFFGGINGISSFFPAMIKSKPEKITIFFTSIKANNQEVYKDTAINTIDNLVMPYNSSSLSFDFVAIGPNNPDAYVYQYKMEGIDNQWIPVSDPQTVHYFLPPGDYIFKVYAAGVFDKQAKPLKEIAITIHPPFWKLWWVRLLLALLFAALLAWLINLYNSNRYQKKLAGLESNRKLQLERERISRDLHDNIGAYANAVIYNTELLQKENGATERNELMNDLRFASKDIITSLRETIWALKKDSYTSQDCLLRIRNFVQPFNRYYEHIQFTVNGEAPEGISLHYTHALNLVRIVQEAVSNAIKHTNATAITVNSKIENGKWKLTVTDDGQGFDHTTVESNQEGNGLNNMRQRAADAGFEFLIKSVEGKGTVVSVGVG